MRKYNFIYSEIVHGDTDIVGCIAYSLYKADKIRFIEGFKSGHNGKEPAESDFKYFHDVSKMNIERYRLEASQVLGSFSYNTLNDTVKDIETSIVYREKELLKDVIAPIKPKSMFCQYVHGTIQGILGAFIFAILLAAFWFIKTYTK